MKKMCWNVYVEDVNRRRIEQYNIFEHGRFATEIEKAYKKHRDDFDAFAEEVKNNLRYYFWSKCEWEIMLNSLFTDKNFKPEKIDVYDQVMLNWDVFIGYVWKMAHTRKNAKD